MAGGLGDVPPDPLPCEGRGKIWRGSRPGERLTQNFGEPSVNEGGQTGGPGGTAPRQGVGGCAPKNQKMGRVARISNPATSGAKSAGKPSAYEGGKNGGVEGAQPPPRGLGGCAPKFFK